MGREQKNRKAVYESGGLVDPNVMKGLVSTVSGPISERTSDFKKKVYEAQKQTAEIRNQPVACVSAMSDIYEIQRKI